MNDEDSNRKGWGKRMRYGRILENKRKEWQNKKEEIKSYSQTQRN